MPRLTEAQITQPDGFNNRFGFNCYGLMDMQKDGPWVPVADYHYALADLQECRDDLRRLVNQAWGACHIADLDERLEAIQQKYGWDSQDERR